MGKGDGYCDDENNNPGCDWDGGDCCDKSGIEKQFNYCTTCKCFDCRDTQGDKCVQKATGKCSSKQYKGDGNCGDGNNNAACGWDGGDCCGAHVKKDYCTTCKCRDCTYKPYGDSCISEAIGKCFNKQYKGDGNCDDDNNNAACGWDGGDCCEATVKDGTVKTP